MCWRAQLRLSTEFTAVAQARRFCTESLRDALGKNTDDAVADATLVVSELVTNALSGGTTKSGVTLDVHRDFVRIGVDDDAAGQPHVQHAPSDQGHGRGMMIIERLSRAWGVSPIDGGKQVWAEISLDPELTGQLACTRSA